MIAIPDEARARVAALRQDLDATLKRGDLLRTRGLRQSLDILAIWFPDEVVGVGA